MNVGKKRRTQALRDVRVSAPCLLVDRLRQNHALHGFQHVHLVQRHVRVRHHEAIGLAALAEATQRPQPIERQHFPLQHARFHVVAHIPLAEITGRRHLRLLLLLTHLLLARKPLHKRHPSQKVLVLRLATATNDGDARIGGWLVVGAHLLLQDERPR